MEVYEHTRQHRIDQLESLVDLLSHFGTGQDDLARDKNQKHNLRLHHAVDQTREQLRFVGAEVVVTAGQTLQANRELDVAGANDVLDLEVRELGIEAKLLDDARVLARRQLRVILRLGTGDDHLARGKDQSGGLGLADTHDDSSETLGRGVQPHCPFRSGRCAEQYLWIVLSVARMQRDGLQIQPAVQVDGRDNVPLKQGPCSVF